MGDGDRDRSRAPWAGGGWVGVVGPFAALSAVAIVGVVGALSATSSGRSIERGIVEGFVK